METGDFHYLEWQDIYKVEKPFQILIDLPKDTPVARKTNLVFSEGFEENVADVREHIRDFNLDTHGFTYATHTTQLEGVAFNDKTQVENVYIPECEKILRDAMDGVDQVHIYNWLIRDTDQSTRDGKIIDLNDPLAKLGPSQVVHIAYGVLSTDPSRLGPWPFAMGGPYHQPHWWKRSGFGARIFTCIDSRKSPQRIDHLKGAATVEAAFREETLVPSDLNNWVNLRPDG
ncbi:hypothetical protein B7494_g1008 [Chlorociboria aeruginascens]|nr:hypothetical protein B7494_g1008 [Chlorociboria aeruginascens]